MMVDFKVHIPGGDLVMADGTFLMHDVGDGTFLPGFLASGVFSPISVGLTEIHALTGDGAFTHGITTSGVNRLDLGGIKSADCTDGSVLRMGTSAAPLADTQNGAGFVVGYFTTSDAAGWPAGVYTCTTFTGAGGNGTGMEGDVTVSAAKGTLTGIESFMAFTSGSGRVTGAARVVQGTIDFANAALPGSAGGVYSAACFNIKGEGSNCDISKAQQVNCIELKTEGTFSGTGGKNFQTLPQGSIIYLNGFTAGAGAVLNNSALTWTDALASVIGMRVGVGADGAPPTVYYVPLIPAAEWN
jgi:hypothetical protein